MSFDITSPQNERIKWLVRLRDRKHRDAEGVFVAEGERLYSRALAAGLEPATTFVSESSDAVGDVVTVSPDVLDKASYRNRSQGIIGVFPQFETGLDRITQRSLLLAVEGVEKPGNLGAMLRTAAAAGVDGVIAVGPSVDPFNPNVLRSSTGAVFSVPMAVSDWQEFGPWLGDLDVVATSPDASDSIWDVDLAAPSAILIGAEDIGLSQRALSIATRSVRIPQARGETDSLNASVTAGVVLFEAVRQRTR